MKQYTTPEQTAKLIELGFEKPKMAAPALKWVDGEPTFEPQYTIGELLSLLPDDGVADRRLEFDGFHWFVDWDSFDKIRQTMGSELVDALYDMLVDIKEREYSRKYKMSKR